MSFWSWLTGHDDKESDVYANFDKVEQVVTNLKSISTTLVGGAEQNVLAAINSLNSVNGFSQYIGSVPADGYTSMFDSISQSIVAIGDQVNSKAEGIKKYNESSLLEKIGSTVCMGLSKVGEGFLSVFESIGDGVLSIVGWVSGALGNTDLQGSIGDFIKKDLSHDAFSFYYNSDFAQASAITEDSGAAGACKLVGKAVGYMYAGGAFAGLANSIGLGSTAVGTAMHAVASSTTWGATAAGFLGGLGNGTQSGLQSGMDYNSAFTTGLKEGAIQGGLAFAGGKLGEKLAKNATIKSANNAKGTTLADGTVVDDAYVATLKGQSTWKLSGRETLGKAANDISVAQGGTGSSLAFVKSATGATEIQGYSDAITRAGFDAGHTTGEVVKSGAKLVSAEAKTVVGKIKGADVTATKAAAAQAKADLGANVKQLVTQDNAIVQGAQGAKSLAVGAKNKVTQLASNVKNKLSGNGTAAAGTNGTAAAGTNAAGGTSGAAAGTTKQGLGATVKNAVQHPLQTAKNAASAIGGKLGSINPVVPGAVAATAEAGLTEVVAAPANALNKTTPIVRDYVGGQTANTVSEATANLNYNRSDVPNPTLGPSGSNGYTWGTTPGTQTQNPVTPNPSITQYPSGITPTPGINYTPTVTGSNTGGGGGGRSGGGSGGGTGGGGTGGSGGANYTPYTYTPYTYTPYTYTPYQNTPYSYEYNRTPSYTSYTYTPYQASNPTYTSSYNPSSDGPQYRVDTGTSTGTGTGTGSGTGSGSGTSHTGSGIGANTSSLGELGALAGSDKLQELEDTELDEIDKMIDNGASSLDEIIKASQYMRVPGSTKPVTTTKAKNSAVIPLAAGLSVASAVGLGAKAYLDSKHADDEDEDVEFDYEDDDFNTDGVEGEDGSLEISTTEGEVNTDPSDEYYNAQDVSYPYYFGLNQEN